MNQSLEDRSHPLQFREDGRTGRKILDGMSTFRSDRVQKVYGFRLTPQLAEFIRLFCVEGLNKRQASLKAGISYQTATKFVKVSGVRMASETKRIAGHLSEYQSSRAKFERESKWASIIELVTSSKTDIIEVPWPDYPTDADLGRFRAVLKQTWATRYDRWSVRRSQLNFEGMTVRRIGKHISADERMRAA